MLTNGKIKYMMSVAIRREIAGLSLAFKHLGLKNPEYSKWQKSYLEFAAVLKEASQKEVIVSMFESTLRNRTPSLNLTMYTPKVNLTNTFIPGATDSSIAPHYLYMIATAVMFSTELMNFGGYDGNFILQGPSDEDISQLRARGLHEFIPEKKGYPLQYDPASLRGLVARELDILAWKPIGNPKVTR